MLVIIVTDGQPRGEDRYTIVNAISAANQELARTRYGSDAMSFQLGQFFSLMRDDRFELTVFTAQVGNDQKARTFLEEIDNHPVIGGLVDVSILPPFSPARTDPSQTTSNYENEADDMAKANPPVDLTPELWLVKMMLGGIDSSYDSKDE